MDTITPVSWLQSQWNSVEAWFGHDEFNITVWGTFLVTFAAYWSFGTFFTIVDVTGAPKFMLKYKVQDNVKSYPISVSQLLDLLVVVGSNQLITIPLAISLHYFNVWRGHKMQHELPDLTTAVLHLLGFVVVIEVMFYYSHRLLHHPYFYKRIHKKHHTWISPVAISAAYCHPIEHLVSNLIPVLGGPVLLRSHTLLMWAWFVFATTETLTVHSGYHLPFFESPEFHDFHHLKFNYNFGVIGILDWVHETDSLFRKSKQFVRHKRIYGPTPVKTLIPE